MKCCFALLVSNAIGSFSFLFAFKPGVSVDFLINGSVNESAENHISDKVLLEQFKKVEQLPNQKKLPIKEFLDAFIIKGELLSKFI